MHLDGHVNSPRLLNEDQIVDVKQHFFFMRDVTKFGRLIIDRTDAT